MKLVDQIKIKNDLNEAHEVALQEKEIAAKSNALVLIPGSLRLELTIVGCPLISTCV